MKVVQIRDSYNTWSTTRMWAQISAECYKQYGKIFADEVLNRSYRGMYVEWYLHNIGYWLTLPFIKNTNIKALNDRFKHVDLEEHL